MKRYAWMHWGVGLVAWLTAGAALAHDPIFSPGPHVLYKGGVEIHTGVEAEEAGDDRENEVAVEVTYGLTGDWAAGIELPRVDKDEEGASSSGAGDVELFTKWRFWRRDTLGLQESAAVLVNVKLDTADEDTTPALGTGTTDTIVGLTYGYEGRKWYRWAAVRYRRNGKNDAGLRRGDKLLLDLVGGIRPRPAEYLKPDTVWLLELNGEYGRRAEINGTELANTGGTEWFLSPGIFWTRRNFALKAGVQIPIASDLNGNQQESDFRARLTVEWHL